MEKSMPSRSEILAKFASNVICSECVITQFADELGYDEGELRAMTASFGGGMERGFTCGAVGGALVALSLAYFDADDPDSRQILVEKIHEFYDRFVGRWGTSLCKELIGYDMAVPGEHEKAMESGKISEVCPDVVISAIDILKDLLPD